MQNFLYTFNRWRFRNRARGQPLQFLYDQAPVPARQLFSQTRFLVIDCEMSGLNAKKNQIVSIGWVQIESDRVVNSSGRQLLVQSDEGGGEGRVIHGLLDTDLASAKSAATVLLLLLKQMEGCVAVFHHAPIDLQFLQKRREIQSHPDISRFVYIIFQKKVWKYLIL